MSVACDQVTEEVGNGVAAALQAVDCVAGQTTAAAFGRLFAPGGAMLTVLTILLTLYVAFFAINLLLGRASLGVRSLTPRMMTLGLVLTFVTSWVAYSSVVWNLAVGGPDQIATIITGSAESATQVFAQKIDVVFEALQQASQHKAEGEGGVGAITPASASAFSPEGMMWLGAMLFLLGTVGVLVTARIALAVLIAVGPIFVVMALFSGTRGLFTGWLKGLVMLALVPLFAVLGGSVMLELAVPVLAALVQTPGEVDPQAAIAFFLIGAVHMALMIMVLKVTGAMVSGWRVFGLVPEKGERSEASTTVVSTVMPSPNQVSPVQAQATAHERRIPVSSFAVAPAANDAGALVEGGRRDTRVVTREVASAGAQVTPLTPASTSRARGNRQPVQGSRAASVGETEMTRALIPALSLIALGAAAVARPALADDARIVEKFYDAGKIVRIEGKTKVQATIQFADDEHIENVAIGDSQAWQVTPNKRANLLFVKPLASSASTNMTVVTDRHTYLFDLVASTSAKPLYVLRFTYPDEPKVQLATADGATVDEIAAASDPQAVTDPAALNFAWTGKGDRKLLPARTYDDGTATFLAWPAGSPVPAILIKDSAGTEGPVNFTVRGDVIVVDGVPREIVLRSGKDDATLINSGPVAPAPVMQQQALARSDAQVPGEKR